MYNRLSMLNGNGSESYTCAPTMCEGGEQRPSTMCRTSNTPIGTKNRFGSAVNDDEWCAVIQLVN